MKELDDDTAEFLRTLSDRQQEWRKDPRVVVWAFWIGDDAKLAQAWAKKNEIDKIVFGVVSLDDKKLHAWKINPMAMNTVVLASCAKLAVVSYTDVTAADVDALKLNLVESLQAKK